MTETQTNEQPKKPVALLILDGFGVAPANDGNSITRAKMLNFKRLIQNFPAMTLRASGEEVGLSWGEMGNSEVGHLAIGAGRVYYQTLPRINRDIAVGTFFKNQSFIKAFDYAKKNNSAVHLIGMVSTGRVHSMDEHCYALLELAKQQKFDRVYIHAILDGRDTVYNVAADFIQTLQKKMKEYEVGKLASMSGRFYAMDRDNRWDRTEKAYQAMVLGQGEQAVDPIGAIKASYAKNIFDEQFVPTVLTEGGNPVAKVSDNDAIIFFNFRPDRMRQITKAFVLPDFDKFSRVRLNNIFPVTMTSYEKGLPVEIAVTSEALQNTLAEVISKAGKKQLHIAETEKYAHVTFFLNGTKEDLFPGEDRVIIPSPRVASYDETPAMSVYEVTDRVLKELAADKYDFFVMNFANPDMVAHTGNLEATIKANESVDECLGKLSEALLKKDGTLLITADHGNAEEVVNLRTGEIDKEHSTNPVPLLIIGNKFHGQPGPSGEVPEGDLSLMPPVGMLADVAPTVLSVMGLDKPEEMTGVSLI
ncbi:MAG: 2,3-bisphosphoglycerate-independent phosphoglycerate mutase [Candidatus Uhrbacteria bacterium GW2011_GWE2_45_35]|uniref:2,3-bisphosphoglycerate-independent phosphoglycerate mutase n=2 Tax=Candidatus Uhriibacteriota TaxID=1752732 RepID=A0A0G1LN78_9BACT|nr:MAG: 2,3-bisphosphoglycerate-independent phosphoglycerate mutase [Candidatus Uhrbacteria bacterium GW2011_GWF2_44_350]KKU06641.1 MAG: 2,3-bisphosphoglycerate-independent phosphoglycerate mutase [Candidatus Uhrbacteria bacterium GW2011_GWE2_45_35]HBR80711.1 2,3-bisphosphoglycerate-independent phosphoglycerate mutase [Candidatus Uhrbacteria bacterium]HCU31673.1 2,3-bisphosphoglycerate-independent phosphoglycerate mutase [Candidatus Uhrbacteria bacterium]